MWHSCEGEAGHRVHKLYDAIERCIRCDQQAPDELVALYEMMNWEAFGYGG